MNDRDELARRVAEKYGLRIDDHGQWWVPNKQDWDGESVVPAVVRDALLSAEQRVEELQLDLAKLYAAIGPMDEFDDVGVVVERIKELRAALSKAKESGND